jgi:hypothetical protein
MTHLTQVTVDFATAARQQLRDCYDWHQAVWKAFPGRDGEPREFLTRLDQRRDGFRMLIVSSEQPARPDWCPPGPESWKTKPIPAYVLRAQPLCVPALREPNQEGLQGTLRRLVDEKRPARPIAEARGTCGVDQAQGRSGRLHRG